MTANDVRMSSLRSASTAQRPASARAGISSAELVEACLERIDAVEREVQAWAFLDPEHALRAGRGARRASPARAAARPAARRAGRHQGHLRHRRHADRERHAAVGRPHAAPRCGGGGAAARGGRGDPGQDRDHRVRLSISPGKTRNPHDPEHTPGGSSSGSAAAVAARHGAACAIGSQTNGSVIRPAAFCGVVGFKPTHGLIPRSGVLALSRRSTTSACSRARVEDAALLAEVLVGLRRGGSGHAARWRVRRLLRSRRASRRCRRALPSCARRSGSRPSR